MIIWIEATMNGPIIAGWMEETSGLVKLLAVIGGAVIGALLVGFFSNLLARLATTRKLPPWALNVVRLLGAIAAGWLVALWLFGGGGPGVGGAGGLGIGSGTGHGPSTAKTPTTGQTTAPAPAARSPDGQPQSASESVRIEVLGPAALMKIGKATQPERCYRVETDMGPQLLTLQETKNWIRARLKRQPPLRRLDLVLYNDSPAANVPFVRDLANWAADLETEGNQRVRVDRTNLDKDAPVP
jgi:hypothetical protein